MNSKEDPKYKPDSDIYWTPFVITKDGLVKEPRGEYDSDLFPPRFHSFEEFEQFMKLDQTPHTYDGEFILLPVVRRWTRMR